MLLLVDDDQELGGLLTDYLSSQGYRLEVAHNAVDGLREAISGHYSLIILDVMLPPVDGFEVLRQLRKRSDVPVIMLTARTTSQDRLDGFIAGADDYVAKPFVPAELAARVQAVLRRSGGFKPRRPAVLNIGRFKLDPLSRQVWRKGKLLELTPSEFDIFELLMRSAGRVVSREQMFAVLNHREATPFERSIDVHISHLRRKICVDSRTAVRAVRGIGYLFFDMS